MDANPPARMHGGALNLAKETPMNRKLLSALVTCLLLVGGFSRGQEAPRSKSTRALPGPLSDGRVLLPNGWFLSPAGTQIELGDFPLGLDISPDGRYAAITNNGYSAHSLSIVDLQARQVVQNVPLAKSWLGVRFSRSGDRLYVSGGNDNRVLLYRFADGQATPADTIHLGEPYPKEKISVAGLDLDADGRRLYVAAKEGNAVYVIDTAEKRLLARIDLGQPVYTCLVSRDGKRVYASLWGGSSVAVIGVESLRLVNTIRVGDHPNDMVESPDGKRLFVANANLNTVSVIDLERGKVMETLSTALLPDAPSGSTPNSVALTPDGTRLFVANADNNYIAVMDVSRPGFSKSLGFIPVGWYPTAVRVHPQTNQLVVINGKGGTSKPNPKGPNPTLKKPDREYKEYIAQLFQGTLSVVDMPDAVTLARYTEQVYQNSPYYRRRQGDRGWTKDNPIPRFAGGRSPIKYVFYIIKENRTYDQLFGDIPEGNGDSTLVLFGEKVTPNHHALAREFVLLDNFYCDAEVSADGHNWSMGAYATDYVEKTWPTLYGGRGGTYDYEGGKEIAAPTVGYIWDQCRRHGVSYRSYGEWVTNPKDTTEAVTSNAESLVGHVAPYFRGYDNLYKDIHRAAAWRKEFDEFENKGNLPRFQIIRLPNDHTMGTRPGAPTPRAQVADNDLALGLIVERISHSKFWQESAIFVIEDDAQNGPDHVDAHRTVALVISPWTKRHYVDSELYSTTSMLRTMELILGLPPMSQFDASATPMYRSFTSKPNFAPYTHRPAQIDLDEKNPEGTYGWQRSLEMDFSEGDAIPDIELNEILWKAIKGADSEMPAPVRGAFVRVVASE